MNLNLKIIKHKEFKDVAYFVSSQDLWAESLVLQGAWLNQGFIQTWCLNREQIQINNKDFDNWLVLEEDPTPYILGQKCLRNTTNWVKIATSN